MIYYARYYRLWAALQSAPSGKPGIMRRRERT